jgi:RecA-family ATPase
METIRFEPVPMTRLVTENACAPTQWLWKGFLARENITLCTSLWKAGKTTLLAGLLRALDSGTPFLGRPCKPGHALIVSEESPAIWAARNQAIPVGANARLVSRPFMGRPSVAQWEELLVYAELERERDTLDLLVIDTLAIFLPGRSESDPGTLLDMLTPLRRIASSGVAVFLLHHPRKAASFPLRLIVSVFSVGVSAES